MPTPWTHPNVLQVMGCVMTLAILHGIKLSGWSLNRGIFDSVFSEIYLSPTCIVEEEEELWEKSVLFSLKRDPFLDFYSVEVFSNSINEILEKSKSRAKYFITWCLQ